MAMVRDSKSGCEKDVLLDQLSWINDLISHYTLCCEVLYAKHTISTRRSWKSLMKERE